MLWSTANAAVEMMRSDVNLKEKLEVCNGLRIEGTPNKIYNKKLHLKINTFDNLISIDEQFHPNQHQLISTRVIN